MTIQNRASPRPVAALLLFTTLSLSASGQPALAVDSGPQEAAVSRLVVSALPLAGAAAPEQSATGSNAAELLNSVSAQLEQHLEARLPSRPPANSSNHADGFSPRSPE
ncbi:MAG: hypothetical protein O7F73_03990 [Gammaproteobacteria bacterium]|nr:hypothetical protein [Gammaproteobacteria bacterium]